MICNALRDLLPFIQFKDLENTHAGVLAGIILPFSNHQIIFFASSYC